MMFPPDGGSSPAWASSPLKLEQEIKAEMQVRVLIYLSFSVLLLYFLSLSPLSIPFLLVILVLVRLIHYSVFFCCNRFISKKYCTCCLIIKQNETIKLFKQTLGQLFQQRRAINPRYPLFSAGVQIRCLAKNMGFRALYLERREI